MLRNPTNYTIYDPDATRCQYYRFAIEIMDLIHKRFPRGAFNIKENVEKHHLSEEKLVPLLNTLTQIGNELDVKKDLKKMADLLQTVDGGNCGTFTNYAIGYMKPRYPYISFECMYLNHHVTIVIGRSASSNPKDIKTWNPATLICDSWSEMIYLACNFERIRKQVVDILYYGTDRWNGNRTLILANTYTNEHYLAGKPTIFVGNANEAYDAALVSLVEEDEKRQNYYVREFTEGCSHTAVLNTAFKATFKTLMRKDCYVDLLLQVDSLEVANNIRKKLGNRGIQNYFNFFKAKNHLVVPNVNSAEIARKIRAL